MSVQEATASYDCKEPNCDQDAKQRNSYCEYHLTVRADKPVVFASKTFTLTRLGEVARRIATITSITRTRGEDTVRVTVHGGSSTALRRREEAAIARLEAVAAKLEATI